MKINKKHRHQGFSLVELMVAMVVGLIILSGAFSMHSASRSAQKISEVQMDMVADARFAIELIANDLRHAGSWGGTNKHGLIECKSTDAACVAVPAAPPIDCATVPGWAYNLSLPIFATDGVTGNPYSGTCIGTGESYRANTDILEIRYADATAIDTADLRVGQVYVRSNFINGRVFVGQTEPVLDAYNGSSTTGNHELHAYAYYISDFTDDPNDGIPSLRRVALLNGPALSNQILVPGVTDLQVQFGIDFDDDQIIDSYVNADNIALADWRHVYAVKIWLMMRSDERQMGIDTTKNFNVPGVVDADDIYGGVDNFRYFMVTSVINLRNSNKI